MTDFTVGTADAFADGTTIGAYPASAWAGSGAIPSGAPLGTATDEQDVADSEVTFTGLTAGVDYYAAEDDSGTRYIRFTVPTTDLDTSSVQSLATDVQAALDADDSAISALQSGLLVEAGARVIADAALDRDRGLGGYTAPGWQGVGPTTQTLAANRAYAVRFVPSRTQTVTAIRFVVTTAAGADDAVDVGIYNASTLARVASSGATTGKLNSGGSKSVSLSASLTAGTAYYAAICCGTLGGSAAALYGATFGSSNGSRLFADSGSALQSFYNDSAHPLPSTLAVTSVQITSPFLAVMG